ncbi:MAG: hypothetical protein JRG83_13185 [Deltaproteobacteria bacterium]|nr:hypothetical protein [Deltaproteobacteria bacterium]
MSPSGRFRWDAGAIAQAGASLGLAAKPPSCRADGQAHLRCYGLEGWQRLALGRHHLAAHPDLPVHHVESGDTSLTLLGYALDPERPAATDREVIASWLDRLARGDDLFEIVHSAAGRWVLLHRRPEGDRILHDAAGLRTVVHTVPGIEESWCASDTPLLAAQLGLAEDPERRRQWIGASGRSIIWIPLRETLHPDCRALIPNHVLDLETGEQHRFWPVHPRVDRGLAEVADKGAELLRRIVVAGAQRFPLALGLTAGIDSRMLLAALREQRESVFYFTFCRHRSTRGTHDEVQIPAAILADAGLEHHILECDAPDDPALHAAFQASTATPSPKRWEEALDLARRVPADRVRVSGHVGETARATFSPRIDTSLRRLVRRHHPSSVRAATRALGPWYDDCRELSDRTGYTVRDLHYWESRMGRWAASSQNQYDISGETFTPFNCRALIELLLAAPEPARDKPNGSQLSFALIERLWPELARYPVNPTLTAKKERLARAGRFTRRRFLRWLEQKRRILKARRYR